MNLNSSITNKSIPHFLIIGAQKCGTTSLYNYLIQHPQVHAASHKELHFFDIYFKKGMEWYYKQFPLIKLDEPVITGEASPYYIFHPHAPKRIASILPNVKLIILLRNPVDRAYSHYYHQVRMQTENLSFKQAIYEENNRLKPELIKMVKDENYYSIPYQYYSYLARGRYIEQLQNWMNLFPKKQFLILKSEDFFSNPNFIFQTVLDFLGISPYQLKEYKKENTNNYPNLDINTKNELYNYYDNYNLRLYNYLGTNFNW
ncbi:sulfotransferase domain-containing protein [Bacillus mycoides]|uniref:sulfotransferase domain-containing protein n=1 Tax=Bacillus mycoides TaxID=1405 RepID=UPI002E2248C7|nr:sulfotransferase domain-containing protein [Bacillus mycoides]MED0888970.1 sulfotransferase domain-containing protein [Bacillus mycoides]MED0927822.1 sulfotransferase domain-containing protein [Bacillus mycoides]